MEHIDEGTIHAWLDGALPASEGAFIEAHSASCSACAAAIAEARGLIAASSRILATLDDVPSGVIPTRGLAAETVRPRPASPPSTPSLTMEKPHTGVAPRPHRGWWQRPQLAAAASIAFVAVALSVVWQRSPRTSIADLASDAASEPAVAPAAVPAAPQATAPASPPATLRSAERSAERVAEVAGKPGVAAESTRALTPPAARRNAAAVVRQGPAPNVSGATAATGAAQPLAEPLRDVSARMDRAGREVAAQSNEAKRRETPPPVPAAVAASTMAARTRAAEDAAAMDSMSRKAVPALRADAIVRTEAERLRGEVDVARRSVPAPAAAPPSAQVPPAGGAAKSAVGTALARVTSSSAPTPATLAGCYQLQLTAAARDAGLASAVQLLASGAGEDEARPAYAVRPLPPAVEARGGAVAATATTTAAVVAWRWTLVPNGAANGVALVKGSGSTASRFVMAIASGEGRSLAEGALAATRIACPDR
ncbi:MAG: zf-HC2 domain-containing protein [Gemmatimonadaceae bacterium]|nr:zf-HC2 domain-containing protein [Gemmatimonadaceae bacterium]